MQQGGYQRILSIDISSVAIKHMQEAHAHIPQLKYRIADARWGAANRQQLLQLAGPMGSLHNHRCSGLVVSQHLLVAAVHHHHKQQQQLLQC